MSRCEFESDAEFDDELAAVAALIFTMEHRGVLSRAAYGRALERLWQDRSTEACFGKASAVIDHMFDVQGHDIGTKAAAFN